MNHARLDRALALACDRALSGLTPEQELELVGLLPPGQRIDPGLELAAAAITLAELSIDEPLPRHLADLLLASAVGGAAQQPVSVRGGTVPITRPDPSAPLSSRTVVMPRSQSAPPPQAPDNVVPLGAKTKVNPVPWIVAAASIGIAASALLYTRFVVDPVVPAPVASVSVPVPVTAPVPEKLTPSQARSKLMTEATDLVRTTWGETGDQAGKGETGEVVWSNARQEGYMTFRAVASNDPKALQYQLWIFDAERDERYPVDGGVFDVDTSKGEVTIPISAKVAVGKPTLFAVTAEKPGGVVVSKRERIVVAAKPG